MKRSVEQWHVTHGPASFLVVRHSAVAVSAYPLDILAIVGPPVGLGFNKISRSEAESIARVVSALPQIVTALKEVEWSAETPIEGEDEVESACPWCDVAKRFGHADVCGLGEALRLAGDWLKTSEPQLPSEPQAGERA